MIPFDVLPMAQGTPEWLKARAGRLTGSRASDMLAKIKSGEAAGRRNLRAQLVVERLTGEPQEDGFVSDAMRRGTELEPEARIAYEAETGLLVEQSGFLACRDVLMGCSLDGHVGAFDGIIEIKVPKAGNHLAWLRGGCVPSEYLAQITHNLAVSGAAWCDFVSYGPQFPPALQLFVCRVRATDVDIPGYLVDVDRFLAEVQTEYDACRTLANTRGVLREAVA